MIAFKTSVYFYHGGTWVLCSDVLQDPPPSWEYGLPGAGPMDLVADTGILTFTLDNTTSNSNGLSGYYSTGHPNCPAWFVDGLPVKVVCERQDTFVSAVRFLGEMVDARPTSGVFEEATVEVEAHDWMEYASIQKLGQLAIQTTKKVNDALTTALLDFPIQPAATDFDAGVETFASIFNTDDSMKQTMASLFQKMARNECAGHIFLEGDGTLRFDNRNVRPATTTPAFTLDATGISPMNELEVSWDRKAIKNRIEAKLFPSRVDAGSGTVLWKLQKTFPLSAGQSLALTCPYRDPATGARISASNVGDPLVSGTHIKFGSVDDGATNDLITHLAFPLDVGGNTAEIALANTVPATQNCEKNPSFENNVTDGPWNIVGAGSTKTRITTDQVIGAACLEAVMAGAGWDHYIYSTTAATAITPYTVSFYAKTVAGDATLISYFGTGSANFTLTGNWQRFSYTGVGNGTGDVYFMLAGAGTFRLDGVQVELQTAATTYCDGDQGGGSSWDGAAHNSTSTRTAPTAGYVNFIELWGRGIYVYEPMVLASEDAASILDRGERVLTLNLEQLTNPNTAETYVASLKTLLANPTFNIERVRFLANFSDAFATAALTAEVNTRFSIAEAQTHAATDVFACRLKYEQEGPHLWVEIVPAPAGADICYFIYDLAGHGYDQGRYTI